MINIKYISLGQWGRQPYYRQSFEARQRIQRISMMITSCLVFNIIYLIRHYI